MKKELTICLLLFVVLSPLLAQINDKGEKFVLHGKINGESSGNIILKYWELSTYKRDTTKIKDGEFVFKGIIVEPTLAEIDGGNNLNSTYIYLEPGEMNITLTKDKFNDAVMTGSKTQEERNECNKQVAPFIKQFNTLNRELSQLNDSIDNSKDSILIRELENKYDKKRSERNKIDELINTTWINFILLHPKSFVSGSLLLDFNRSEILSPDSLESIYNNLDITIQNSIDGKKTKKDIQKKKNNAVGALAPDFKAFSINKQQIVLSEFKGKSVVLLEFWASWCKPCRESFSQLKELFKKYHSKGLDIIAVSIDQNKASWLSVIKKDSIDNWHHIFLVENSLSGQIPESEIMMKYFVQAIPVKILIDKEGKIIGRWVGFGGKEEELFEKQIAELFRNM